MVFLTGLALMVIQDADFQVDLKVNSDPKNKDAEPKVSLLSTIKTLQALKRLKIHNETYLSNCSDDCLVKVNPFAKQARKMASLEELNNSEKLSSVAPLEPEHQGPPPVQAPVVKVHFQPPNKGPQVIEFNSETTDFKTEVTANSMLNMQIKDDSQILQSCTYSAPNEQEVDCRSWVENNTIWSVTEQDLGLHKIRIQFSELNYEYQFQVIRIR